MSFPNNLGLDGPDPQITCILDWAYPTMRGPKEWLVVSSLVLWWFLSIEPHQVQLGREGYHATSPLFEAQAGLLSPRMDFSHFSCVSLPNFCSNLIFLPLPPYLYQSLSGVVMMEEYLSCQQVPPYCITH